MDFKKASMVMTLTMLAYFLGSRGFLIRNANHGFYIRDL